MQMRLKCAIESVEDASKNVRWIPDGIYEVLAAAKRDLQRQEQEKPKRASLAVIEDSLRYAAPHLELLGKPHAERCAVEAADILKALRENVVPLLQLRVASLNPMVPADSRQILKWLGED